MNRIRLLPEQVANQIAAGEVIERPASVVKELVENSLDAQAGRVSVEIHAGGRSLIRVTDNGVGMSRDDALLCLERHATSKIQRAEDLSAIATLGFRGEALPSIASVSRFTLTTRERQSDNPEGTQVVVNGGKITAVNACGSAPGVTVEVRQLFFNLPARRKFLRSEETESTHIQHYLTLAALAFPTVAFDFSKDGRLVWQLPAVNASGKVDSLLERLRALSYLQGGLLPLDRAADAPPQGPSGQEFGPLGSCRLWGFIGAPGVSRASREEHHIFVNRRPVENRGINFALLEGYHTALMKGRYPVCCLFLEIDPAQVDINIHPAKREVKFYHEKAVREFFAQAVRETLLTFHSPPAAAARQPVAPPSAAEQAAPPPFSLTLPPPPPAPAPTTPDLPALPKLSRPLANWPLPPGSADSSADLSRRSQAEAEASATAQRPAAPPLGRSDAVTGPVALLQVPLRLVGVIGRLYVVLESDRGLVLMDQHAAHERVLFEQMLRRLEQGDAAPSQRLLLPQTVELPVRDASFLRGQMPTLVRLGVGLSEFGERTFLLDSMPPYLKSNEPRRFLLQLVDELKAAGQGVNPMRLGELVIAKTVCRHAVKANDPLQGRELENLLEQLRHCAMPYTCPHGRPTLIEMSFRELEKKFGRSP